MAFGDILSTRRGHDPATLSERSVDPRVHLLQARIAPIQAIMQNMNPAQGNGPAVEVEWIERETMPNTFTLTGGWTIADLTANPYDETLVQIGDYILNQTKGIVAGPVTVRATGAVDVGSRAALGTTDAAWDIGDRTIILRGTLEDGGDAPSPLIPVPTVVKNYIEHTSTPYGNSELLQAIKTYANVHSMEDLAPYMMINHDQYIEEKVLYGKNFLDDTGTRAKYFSGGAFEFITDKTTFTNGSVTFTETQWNTYLEQLFEHSGPEQRKQVFLSGTMLRQIQEFKLPPLEIPQGDLMKNVAIFSYMCSFGQVDLIHHRFLNAAHGTENIALGLDMEVLEWFNLIPTQVKENIQSNRSHTREDEIHQASAVKWINAAHHRILQID